MSALDDLDDAELAAALFAVDPAGLGGVWLRARAGVARDRWLKALKAWLPEGTPWRRVPLNVADDQLLGGLDLGATLQTGRPVAQAGLLAQADGGVLLLAMAERASVGTAARLAHVLDRGEFQLERDGLAARVPARVGLVALDEGAEPDERPPAALCERLALVLDLDARPEPGAWLRALDTEPPSAAVAAAVQRARARLPQVRCADELRVALCEAALALGVYSLRAPLQALSLARAAAALDGRDELQATDAALAARLVLAPRATRLPEAADDEDTAAEEPPPPPDEPPPDDRPEDAETPEPPDPSTVQPLDEQVLEAALASLPPDLLAQLAAGQRRAGGAPPGRAGVAVTGPRHGRPIGARRGEPRGGARLHLVETLRAAAPWQPLRRREAAGAGPLVRVHRDDLRVQRLQQRTETTTVFAVDASGSAAVARLAEAKGAVELLLADCYVRRDRVALLAFRGRSAELLLPPTRSLVRAKRSLAGLPGGGGTPLAAGLDAALELADSLRRRGGRPVLVLLTDGRANIGRNGEPGRPQAQADALAAARQWRAAGFAALLVDTSAQPQAVARELAQAMGARYLPLPMADALRMSRAVRAAGG